MVPIHNPPHINLHHCFFWFYLTIPLLILKLQTAYFYFSKSSHQINLLDIHFHLKLSLGFGCSYFLDFTHTVSLFHYLDNHQHHHSQSFESCSNSIF